MPRLLRIIRTAATAFAAMRYPISSVTALLAMLYGLLTESGVVPLYTNLAADWRVAPRALLVLLYLAVAAFGTAIWQLWVLRPPDATRVQLQLRPLYRTTDPAGLGLLNAAVLMLLAGGVVLAPLILQSPVLYDPAIFLAVVLALPVTLDFWPGVRPRRIAARPGLSLRGIALQIGDDPARTEETLAALLIYNEIDPTDTAINGPELPEGFVVEIPPRS